MVIPENFVIPEYVYSIEKIEEYLDYLDETMSTNLNGESIEDITGRMTDLMSYRPVVNDMYSSARYYLDLMKKAKYDEIKYNVPDSLKSASILKDYVSSCVAEFQWLYNKCERTNKGLTHYLDECRSLLSKEKELHKTKNL